MGGTDTTGDGSSTTGFADTDTDTDTDGNPALPLSKTPPWH